MNLCNHERHGEFGMARGAGHVSGGGGGHRPVVLHFPGFTKEWLYDHCASAILRTIQKVRLRQFKRE